MKLSIETNKRGSIFGQIDRAIKNLELRMNLNAQSIVPISSNGDKNDFEKKAVKRHNQRAIEVVEECQQNLDKLILLQMEGHSIPQQLLSQLFRNYRSMDIQKIQAHCMTYSPYKVG